MSRTVLLSEVSEVSDRFPEAVARVRSVLVPVALPASGPAAIAVLADRIAGDEWFREVVEDAVQAMCATAPEASSLEVLGALLVAAAGPEQAQALMHATTADRSLRALFNFVLSARRRRREPDAVPQPSLPVVSSIPSSKAASSPVAASAVPRAAVTSFPKPRVTTTSPGDSGMLARALAIAADEDLEPFTEPHIESFEAPTAPTTSQATEESVPVDLPVLPLGGVAQDICPYDGEEDDPADVPPRRWGLWTAVTCGVLLGFGLGVFAHFDSGSRRLAHVSSAAATPTADQNASNEQGKSIGALQAEIAAMDSVASLLPGERGTSESGRKLPGLSRERQDSQGDQPRQASHFAKPDPAVQMSAPVTSVRDAATTPPKPAWAAVPTPTLEHAVPVRTGPPTEAVYGARPAPLTAASLAGRPSLSSETVLPRVITGSAGIMAANLISSPAPAYPAAASAAGVQGEVVVEAVVGRGGDVVDTRIVSGPMLLRAAALDAVQRWHYRPYEVDGKPIEVATTARLDFRLGQ